MNMGLVKPDQQGGQGKRRASRPWRWLGAALVLGVLGLVMALGAPRGYALERRGRQAVSRGPILETLAVKHLVNGKQPLGVLGGDNDDGDDDEVDSA